MEVLAAAVMVMVAEERVVTLGRQRHRQRPCREAEKAGWQPWRMTFSPSSGRSNRPDNAAVETLKKPRTLARLPVICPVVNNSQ